MIDEKDIENALKESRKIQDCIEKNVEILMKYGYGKDWPEAMKKKENENMANTKNKQCMAYKNKLAYIKRMNKLNKRFYIIINPKTESELLEAMKLWDKKKGTYVKNLIRKDYQEKLKVIDHEEHN